MLERKDDISVIDPDHEGDKDAGKTVIRLQPRSAGQPKLVVGMDGKTRRIMEMTDNGYVDYDIIEVMKDHTIKIVIAPKDNLYRPAELSKEALAAIDEEQIRIFKRELKKRKENEKK